MAAALAKIFGTGEKGEPPSSGPSTDMSAFRELFAKARNIVALSGAGISAESGVPTFRFVQIMLHRVRIAIY